MIITVFKNMCGKPAILILNDYFNLLSLVKEAGRVFSKKKSREISI